MICWVSKATNGGRVMLKLGLVSVGNPPAFSRCFWTLLNMPGAWLRLISSEIALALTSPASNCSRKKLSLQLAPLCNCTHRLCENLSHQLLQKFRIVAQDLAQLVIHSRLFSLRVMMHCLSMQRRESHHEQQGHQEFLCSFACEKGGLMSVQLGLYNVSCTKSSWPGSAILVHAASICTSSIYMQ